MSDSHPSNTPVILLTLNASSILLPLLNQWASRRDNWEIRIDMCACQFSSEEEKLRIWPSNLPIGSFLWVFMSWPAQLVNYELASPSEVNHLLWCLNSLEGKPGHAHSSVRSYWRALSFLCPHYALASCMMPASFSLSLICRSWWWCKGSQPCNQEMLWFIKNLESLGQSIITLLHLWK